MQVCMRPSTEHSTEHTHWAKGKFVAMCFSNLVRFDSNPPTYSVLTLISSLDITAQVASVRAENRFSFGNEIKRLRGARGRFPPGPARSSRDPSRVRGDQPGLDDWAFIQTRTRAGTRTSARPDQNTPCKLIVCSL